MRTIVSHLMRMLRSAPLAILVLAVPSTVHARTETLRWLDSNPAPSPVVGFRVHTGPSPRTYSVVVDVGLPPDAAGVRSYDLAVADQETIYVAMTAYDADGLDSIYSNEQERAPAPPPPVCGNGVLEGTEQCDGASDLACPGLCQADCTCAPPPPNSSAQIWWENFETLPDSTDPPNWVDTQAGSSLVPDDSLFKVVDLGGNKAFGTESPLNNIHSHYISSGSPDWSAYEYQGRMLITDPTAGIGVTVHSQYTNADAYYRLRRTSTTPDFHITQGGLVGCGNNNTGIVPAANVWYRFRVEVVPDSVATSLRVKVWEEGTAEPASWQVICSDTRPERHVSGAVGVWSMNGGSKYWDDLQVVDLSGQTPPEPALTPPQAPELSLP